jgi:uncharacterized small protein (DUF1192 family)
MRRIDCRVACRAGRFAGALQFRGITSPADTGYAPGRLRSILEIRLMSNGSLVSLDELERRIAIVRDNIRELVEQAAAFSGAEDEERNADRMAQQNEELERLIKERDALLGKLRSGGASG